MFVGRALIHYTWDMSIASWRGYAYAVLMFGVAFTQTIVLHQYNHRCYVTGMRIRSSIIAAVYEKVSLFCPIGKNIYFQLISDSIAVNLLFSTYNSVSLL